mgnify:FL=1
MSRVRFTDPIFYTGQQGGVATLQFTEDLQNPDLWRSYLPGATFYDALAIDPGLKQGWSFDFRNLDDIGAEVRRRMDQGATSAEAIADMIRSGDSGFMEKLKEVAALDVVRSLRAAVGQIAVSVGFADEVMSTHVRGVYRDPLREVAMALDYVQRVFNSEAFQQAVAGIAWIPIIGWIIAILVDILTMIADIAEHVRRKRIQKMTAEMANRYHLPMLAENKDAQNAYNETMVRQILTYASNQPTRGYQLWRVFQPPAIIPNGSGQYFETVAARPPDAPKHDTGEGEVELTERWYLRPRALAGGSGFVPGGTDIVRQLEFMPEHGGAIPVNTGDYMPTARSLAGYLWGTVLSPGPSMFTIDTEATEENWNAFVHGLLEYGERCILKGFTVSQSSVIDTHTWDTCTGEVWCGSWNIGASYCDKKGVRRTFPGGWGGVQHMNELIAWVTEEFWARGADKTQYPFVVRDRRKPFSPDTWFYQNTVYAHALRNLKERQRAALRDYEAFYVFPGNEFEDELIGGGTVVRKDQGVFPVFGQPGHWNRSMIELWEQTLTAILNHDTPWPNVNWRSVPQYRWKGQSPREILRQKFEKRRKGFIAPPGGVKASVPGGMSEYPPPPPPDLAGTARLIDGRANKLDESDPAVDRSGRMPLGAGMPTPTRVMLAASAAMGAVGAGAVLYDRFGRRYFT